MAGLRSDDGYRLVGKKFLSRFLLRLSHQPAHPVWVLTIVALGLGIVVALVLPIFIHLKSGLFFTPDSNSYVIWAGKLSDILRDPLNGEAYNGHLPITYLGHLIIVRLSQLLLGADHYGWGVVSWAAACLALGAASTARELAWRLPQFGKVFAIIGVVYPMFSINLHFHGRAVLTDVAFSGLVLLTVAVVLRLQRKGLSGQLAFWGVLVVALATLYRPTGLIIPLFLIAVWLLSIVPKGWVSDGRAIGSIVAIGLVWFLLLALFSNWALENGGGRFVPNGIVSDPGRFGGFDVILPVPKTVGEVIAVVLYRMAYYFRVWVEYYSISHNLTRLIFYLPIHLGVFAGFLAVVSGQAGDNAARAWWSLAILVLGLVSFQAWLWSIADFNRYYTHSEPTELLLGLFGWMIWVTWIWQRHNRPVNGA